MAGMSEWLEGYTSRYEAAEILRKVADDGEHGLFPSDVTCEELGRALHRICINSPEEHPLEAILLGWHRRMAHQEGLGAAMQSDLDS